MKDDRILQCALRMLFICVMVIIMIVTSACSTASKPNSVSDVKTITVVTMEKTPVVETMEVSSAVSTTTAETTTTTTVAQTEMITTTTVTQAETTTTAIVTPTETATTTTVAQPEETTADQIPATTTTQIVYRDPMDALKHFEKSQNFLQDRGEKYTLYYGLRKRNDGSDWGTYCSETGLVSPMCRIISDFDQDDSPELLQVEIDSDYMLNAKMYEVVDGIVQLASDYKLNISVETTENAHVRCAIYCIDDHTRIGFVNDSHGSLYSDGRELQFTVLSYADQKICEIGRERIAGSWISEDVKLEYEETLKLLLGVSAAFEDVWSEGAEGLVKLLPNAKVFGRIDTTCPLTLEEWSDVEPGENDPPLHLSDIEIN